MELRHERLETPHSNENNFPEQERAFQANSHGIESGMIPLTASAIDATTAEPDFKLGEVAADRPQSFEASDIADASEQNKDLPVLSLAEYDPQLYSKLTNALATAETTNQQMATLAVTPPEGKVFGIVLSDAQRHVIYTNEEIREGMVIKSEGSGIAITHDGQWFVGDQLYSAAYIGPRAYLGDYGDYQDLDGKPSFILRLSKLADSDTPPGEDPIIGLHVTQAVLQELQIVATGYVPTDSEGGRLPVFTP